MQTVAREVDASIAAADVKSAIRRGGLTILVVTSVAGILLLTIFAGILPPAFGVVATALVLTTVFWIMRAHVHSILLVFVGVLLVSVIVTHRIPKLRPDRIDAEASDALSRKWQASGKFNEKLPIVVHLVLDEMMSPGAMTDDLPGGSATRQALLDFAERHSLRTFDSVYSRYYSTSESLPHLMNSEYLGRTSMASFSVVPFNPETKSYAVPANAYFDDMSARGYRTVVFQNTYMNFCANESVDMCENFNSFDPGAAGAGMDAPTQRVEMWQNILRAYAPSYTSVIGQRALGLIYGLNASGEIGVVGYDGGRYDVQRFPESFDRFTRFVASVPRGTHVFAHFLVPHAPYLMLESCVVSGKVDHGYSLSRHPRAEQAGKRMDYYARYLAQLRCVASKLSGMMAAIDGSDKFREAVIVIHGDHGSRISISNIVEDYTERDFVDNYGTFFAVRAPGVKPGVDCEFVSLPEVFRRHVARGGQAVPPAKVPLPVVVVSRTAGHPKVEAPMPRFGCASAAVRDDS
jgi:hypothetical protein